MYHLFNGSGIAPKCGDLIKVDGVEKPWSNQSRILKTLYLFRLYITDINCKQAKLPHRVYKNDLRPRSLFTN